MLKLKMFDAKMSGGNARTYGGLSNALRVMLRELGLKAKSDKAPVSLAQIAARQCRKTRGRAGVKPLVARSKTRAMAILGAYLGALAIIATY
jgi:hypothetical protein